MAVLSEVSGFGFIKRCPGNGCIHLNCLGVTLNFGSGDDFAKLARNWTAMVDDLDISEAIATDPKQWMVCLEYGRVSLRLYADEAVELGRLLNQAMEHLKPFLPVLPEDFWPEGSAYVPIPDFSRVPTLAGGIEE